MTQLKELMDIIGKKRFITLMVLLVIAGGLGFLWQQVLIPAGEDIEREKQTIESDRSRLQRELVELPVRYKTLLENEARYDALMQTDFISSQDRLSARSRINAVREASNLRGMTYAIAPLERVTDQSTQGLEGQLVRSRISVTMQGLSDIEMRDFVQNMQADFGGLIILRDAEFKREKEFSTDSLKELSEGKLTHFVSGKVTLEWYSIIPPVTTATPSEGAGQ